MLNVDNITKQYDTAGGTLRILNGVTLSIQPGATVSIMGPSGSGKSTLLSILGALEAPTSGTVTLHGQNPFTLGEAQLAAFRNKSVGFVFQDHHLLPQCTVLENVLIPVLATGDASKAEPRARELLDRVGLSGRLTHLPAQLSGGEKQRVAIARALIREPRLLLCDEPTGNLDSHSSDNVADLLFDLPGRQQVILIVVTHSDRLAARASERYSLADGKLV